MPNAHFFLCTFARATLSLSTLVFAGTLSQAHAAANTTIQGGAELPALKTNKGLYQVRYVFEPSPLKSGVKTTCTLTITDAKGQPLNGFTLTDFAGSMPEHGGHGFANKPTIARPFAPGQVKVSNVQFSMAGKWQVTLTVKSAAGTDSTTLDLQVP